MSVGDFGGAEANTRMIPKPTSNLA